MDPIVNNSKSLSEGKTYKLQYRLYKYIITRLDDAITIFRDCGTECFYIKPWLRGLRDDLCEILAVEQLDKSDELFILIEDMENGDSNEAVVAGAERLKIFFATRVHVFVKIDVLFSRPQAAAFLLPVYYELQKDTLIVGECVARRYAAGADRRYCYDTLEKLKETLNGKVEYCEASEYKIQDKMPDVIVHADYFGYMSRPLKMSMSCVREYVRRIVFIDFSIVGTDVAVGDPRKSVFPQTWLDCCESPHAWRARHLSRDYDIKNSVITGHPIMDTAHRMYILAEKYELPKEWQRRLDGKKVILWNTGFFKTDALRLIEKIIQENTDIAIICRPHPETIATKFNKALNHLDELSSNHTNLIIDRFSDYSFSLSAADAYIGDTGSLYLQFIPSGKPSILIIENYIYRNTLCWARANIAQKDEDILEFVSLLKSGDSSFINNPEADFFTGPVDGKSCERIRQAIMKKFYDEEYDFIKKYLSSFAMLERMQ